MEMNFPHEALTKSTAKPDANPVDVHHALLSHAIARQSLSASALAFVACGGTMETNGRSGRSDFMDDRIRFFAGQPFTDQMAKCEKLFPRGHFRPDLAGENEQGERRE